MLKQFFTFKKGRLSTKQLSIKLFILLISILSILILLYVIFTLLRQDTLSNNLIIRTLILLSISMIMIIAMALYTGWRVISLFLFKHRKETVPYIKMRFVGLFSLAALIPAILVGIFLSIIFTWAFDYWFQGTVRRTLENAKMVANTYVNETIEDIRSEMKAMTIDLDQAKTIYTQDKKIFRSFFKNQTLYRRLSSAYLIDRQNMVLVKAESPNAPEFHPPSREAFEQADSRKMSYSISRDKYLIWCMVKLQNYQDTYLYTVRYVPKGILDYVINIGRAVGDYQFVQSKRGSLLIIAILAYTQITLLILIGASWFGIAAANRLSAPIEKLVNATRLVRKGDYTTRIETTKKRDEIDSLILAFNRMTRKLETQHMALLDSHAVAENRRIIIEAVLSGITAGVISLDIDKRIILANHSACNLLDIDSSTITGRPIQDILSEFHDFILQAEMKHHKATEKEILIERKSQRKTLHVRLSINKGDNKKNAYVITFDDITELVIVQRNMAWQDVARRIAHEIKNPLTPIQLSAERIKRKYNHEIKTDSHIFLSCIDTIIRHAGNISRMVTEFSAFAQTPTLEIQETNICNLIQNAIFTEHMVFPDIDFQFDPEISILSYCDGRLLIQALTNILKNSCESIMENKSKKLEYKGMIKIAISKSYKEYTIEIIDNGTGFPEKDIQNLVEPYVTTRVSGTGLGLAIVKRIIEDHGGNLELVSLLEQTKTVQKTTKQKKGALVRIRLPVIKKEQATSFVTRQNNQTDGIYYEA